MLVVAAGSKMVSSLVKASYNITYADNSSSSYTRNEISSKRKNNTGSSSIKEWGSNVVKDVEKSISSIGGCKAKGCSDPVYKNGYCSYHYAYKTGRDALDHASENIKSGIDSIKENRELFPVVTIIIMEAFINKMRRLKGVRKQLIVEEAWKALSSANMAEYLRYMYKTVRKYYGEAIVVTQEVDDIISSPVVKESIINNSDCKILLDQRKYMNKFDAIQSLLGLTEKEKSQILSINMANNPSRLYKEVWIGLGGTQSAVYATEVSAEEYLAYTTEETEKVEVYRLAEQLGGDIEAAIRQLAERRRNKE